MKQRKFFFGKNGDTTSVTTKEYDQKNNLIHSTHQRDNSGWHVYYTYDSHNNELSSKTVFDGLVTEAREYKYDSLNNNIEVRYFDQGKLEYVEEKFYSGRNCIKELFFNAKQQLLQENIFEYDASGNIIKETKVDFRKKKKNRTEVYIWKYEQFWTRQFQIIQR